MKNFLLLILFAFSINTCTGQTEITIREIDNDSVINISKYLYKNEKPYGTYKGGRIIKEKLSKTDKRWNSIFKELVKDMKSLGLNIKYPHIIYEDICKMHTFISTMVSSFSISEMERNSVFDKGRFVISNTDVNQSFTYLYQHSDYLFSFQITFNNNMIENYKYTCRPDLDERIMTYNIMFTYDNKGRVTKITETYSDKDNRCKGMLIKDIEYTEIGKTR
ncbi:MAG: hypothetical protein ILA29_07945 [Prevotella sp.]|nr:hypothetical protein [Prevotella sp.]